MSLWEWKQWVEMVNNLPENLKNDQMLKLSRKRNSEFPW